MGNLDFLKNKISEITKSNAQKKPQETETVDMEQVEKIVNKMKQKYSDTGVVEGEVSGELGELRGIIAEGKQKNVELQSVEELREFQQPLIRQLGGLYLALKNPLQPIMKTLQSLPQVKQLSFWLYSANMKYSTTQYLAITTSVAVIGFFAGLILSIVLLYILNFDLAMQAIISIVSGLVVALFATLICLIVPKSIAMNRGSAISSELPFALRHMSTELRSGIGLYRTIQAVAVADYGVLSEEFAKTINEVEEGTETKEALSHLASRTQSKALRNVIIHIIRALKTGGNLSEIMNSIAQDVSFELREKIRDFAERMNFFGVIFIFGGIVVPVMIAVLGSIKNSPLPIPLNIPLDPTNLMIFYLVLMPLMLAFLVFYIRTAQPKA